MQRKTYDFIFLGAGCASLSIVMRMILSGSFGNKKILLADRVPKVNNDRTWCFWEKSPGFFESIVYRKWSQLVFISDEGQVPLEMDGYEYKMIRGIDFYNYCFAVLGTRDNVDIVYGEISLQEESGHPGIQINGDPVEVQSTTIVFNSLYAPPAPSKNTLQLLQHFKGRIIETQQEVFNPRLGTLMDFRVAQSTGTTFVYVLPLSSTTALVEYTLFSKDLLEKKEYDAALNDYIDKYLQPGEYSIKEEEFGMIPMTNARFPFFKNGMFHIGTAGGQTKASTGYTFHFIQKQAEEIVGELVRTGSLPGRSKGLGRFYFYDSTLLHILYKGLLPGKTIFSILFRQNKGSRVLKFLDNETSLSEELQLLATLPKRIFIKAGALEILRILFSSGKS
jgi:lycopene beta-cyclase